MPHIPLPDLDPTTPPPAEKSNLRTRTEIR